MIIYLVTNTINGKQYIGQTLCTPAKRWQEHVYNASGNPARSAYPLYHAIRKYGSAAFFVSTLETAVSQKDLNQKEIDFIYAYQTMQKTLGYNRHEGGNRPPQHTAESRAKAAASNRGQKRTDGFRQFISAALTGIKRSEETKRKISISKTNPSDETRKRMSEAAKNRNPRKWSARRRAAWLAKQPRLFL